MLKVIQKPMRPKKKATNDEDVIQWASLCLIT